MIDVSSLFELCVLASFRYWPVLMPRLRPPISRYCMSRGLWLWLVPLSTPHTISVLSSIVPLPSLIVDSRLAR